jgi:hypothetical protein
MARGIFGRMAKTGQRCPVSGVWRFDSTTTTVAKGNLMPAADGQNVTWVLSSEAA